MDEVVSDDSCTATVPSLATLPSTAASSIWQQLDPTDKLSVFLCSKASSALFAPCITSLVCKVPSDYEELRRPFSSIPTTHLQGLRLRLARKHFTPHAIPSCPSGEGGPSAMRSLQRLLAVQPGTVEGGTNRCLPQAVTQLELQGFNIQGTAVPLSLAHACSQLHSLVLRCLDLGGPFFNPLAPLHPTLHTLNLSYVQLDSEALQSLVTLSGLTNLTDLTLDRLPGLSQAGCEAGEVPGLRWAGQLRSLQLHLHPWSDVKPCVTQLVDQLRHVPHLTSLQVWDLEGTQELEGSCVEALVRHCPRLAKLEFDRHVIITGVRELLGLRGLTSICTRSLEPQEQQQEQQPQAGPSSDVWAGHDPELSNLVGLPCPWQHLSLGAFCPSLTALASLPLHTLTHPFHVNELDLGAHPAALHGDMDRLALAVRSALTNCVRRCRVLAFTGGKLEVNGLMSAVGVGARGAVPVQLKDAGAALDALEVVRGCGVRHVRLVGLRVTEEELRALGGALGEDLVQVTLCDCVITAGALEVACDGSLASLRQLSFGRRCKGVGLPALVQALVGRSLEAGLLVVRLTKPVGVESPGELDLLASDVDVWRCRQQLQEQGASDLIQLQLCASV